MALIDDTHMTTEAVAFDGSTRRRRSRRRLPALRRSAPRLSIRRLRSSGSAAPVLAAPPRRDAARTPRNRLRRALLARPLGMRVHFGIAMVALAVASVGLAGLAMRRAVDGELASVQRSELAASSAGTAATASLAYSQAGWSPAWVRQLVAAGLREGHGVAIVGASGAPVAGSPAPATRGTESAPIRVDGRTVGAVVIAPVDGAAASGLGAELRGRLEDRLLTAGLLAGGLALLLGLLAAWRMSRPLGRLTDVARRMAHGEIETRASGAGGPRETTELAITLDRLAAALRRQDELRRATVHDIVHEMRNGLVGVVGRIEAMQDGMVMDERAALDRMARDARRLNRLVDDVLLLAEAQKPSLLVRKRPVDFGVICAERIAAYEDRFAEQEIALESVVMPARVDGDPERLAQVLDNLLSNALRYTDPGGRVSARLELRGEEAVLTVSDSGIGIVPEHLTRIFDRFWRDPEAKHRIAEGSGVGLAVVRDLVVAHDGRVEVESRPGAGSVFKVILPCADPADPLVRDAARDWDAGDGRPAPAVWRLRGEIDTANAARIETRLAAAIARETDDVVLDLTDVCFIDSAGMRALGAVARQVGSRGGRAVIAAGPPQVRRVFDLFDLGDVMEIAPTRSEALERLDPTRAEPRGREPVAGAS